MDISTMWQLHFNYVAAIAHIDTLHTSDDVFNFMFVFPRVLISRQMTNIRRNK
jgi:hypothetical protein